jgi:hypothetical protein
MPRPARSEPSLVRHVGLAALLCASTPAALAQGSVQWRLQAHVPVMCAILDVATSADQPTGLAIATSCNAERYRLMLHDPTGQTRLLAARSSAGRAAVSGSAVTITSAQPGYGVTTIELAAPAPPGRLTVTLLPL